MNETFRRYVESLEPAFRQLVSMEPVKVPTLPGRIPEKGIYLFSNGDRHLYVGRTSRLRKRLQQHCRPSSSHDQATFAFRLARESAGKTKATYSPTGSRADLETDSKFNEAFTHAKKRVRRMDVRFVEEADPKRQALLEIYVAVALQTPYNDFETH